MRPPGSACQAIEATGFRAQALSEEHGELAPECAEAYVAYAEAILKRCEHVQDLVACAGVDGSDTEESLGDNAGAVAADEEGGGAGDGGEGSDAAEETE